MHKQIQKSIYEIKENLLSKHLHVVKAIKIGKQ